MHTLNELREMAKCVNGRNRRRTIGKAEAETMLSLVKSADDKAHTIRVYSSEGFVPNSYKWPARIAYFEARRQEAGNWRIIADSCDAKRPYGNAPLITVNSRAV